MTRRRAWIRCAEAGLTQAETARLLGVSREWVSRCAARLGLRFRRSRFAVGHPVRRAAR